MHPTVKIDSNADLISESFANGSHIGHSRIDFNVRVDILHLLATVHLYSFEAARCGFFCILCEAIWTISTYPGIDLDLVANGSAEEFRYRYAKCPALDVPERLIDSCECAHMDTAAAIEPSPVE